jgi:hypothetical protein
MTGSDQAAGSPDARVAGAETQMDAELDALRAKGPAPGAPVYNPVFQYEQRAGTAVDAGRATDMAARVTGEMAAEADQELLAIESEVARLEHVAPDLAQTQDAEAAAARAGHDADEAIAESLDADSADDDARAAEGTHLLHRSADPTEATRDRDRALADETVAARDLADLDGLAARVGGDVAGVPPATG